MQFAHSHVDLLVHIVWNTHLRRPLLPAWMDGWLAVALHQSSERHGGKVLEAGVASDHVHLLVSLDSSASLAAFVHGSKGSVGFFINRAALLPAHLRWQEGYWAESVHRSQLPALRSYLKRQRQHHSPLIHHPHRESPDQFEPFSPQDDVPSPEGFRPR